MNIHFSGRKNGIRVGAGTSHYDYLPILRNANMYRVDLPSLFFGQSGVVGMSPEIGRLPETICGLPVD